MSTSIKFENISKQYRLGLVSTQTLSHDLNRWWKMNIQGKDDPYLKIGDVNDRSTKGESDYVWALKDINFEVQQGDVLGIIGKNGAGKSTLLKILSKVTAPTTGTIKAAGRIASLLEVGTGFHPEMTGRENIFMNGAIMGMTKQEIARKLDEIVDFSGVERYIDTPAKRYSSGMTVRLGFAIAAHLEPEILVVDEVLAVGDAEFQKKAIGKMQDVSKGEGRTVLFVSHNMSAIKDLCTTGIVLKDGSVSFAGDQMQAVSFYQGLGNLNSHFEHKGEIQNAPGNSSLRVTNFFVKPLIGEFISISSGFEFSLTFFNYIFNRNLAITFELRTLDETVIFHHGVWVFENRDSKVGEISIKAAMEPNLLNAGTYKFNFIIAESLHHIYYQVQDFIQFDVQNENLAGNNNILPGVLRPKLDYIISCK